MEIKIDAQPNHIDAQTEQCKAQELAIKRIKFRLTHEKKTIVFMMHTCRKVRNLAKDRNTLGNASNNLMFAGILLLRKGQRLNEIAIQSIKTKTDTYGLNWFTDFTNTQDCTNILNTLQDDQKLYTTLLTHLEKKLDEEVSDPNRKAFVLKMIGQGGISIDQLDQE